MDQFADVHQDRLRERLGFCNVVINAVIEGVGLAHILFLKSLEKSVSAFFELVLKKIPAMYKGTIFILAKRARIRSRPFKHSSRNPAHSNCDPCPLFLVSLYTGDSASRVWCVPMRPSEFRRP